MTHQIKRSHNIALVGVASAVTLSLSACSQEPVDVNVYSSLEQCEVQHGYQACKDAFDAAEAQHADVAPRFANQADCEAEYGASQCEAGSANEAAATESGGSFWMPLLAGYMMGNLMAGSRGQVAPQPLYRKRNGEFRTAAGNFVSRTTGPARVSPQAARAPRAATGTVARGGFGRAGGGSFGG